MGILSFLSDVIDINEVGVLAIVLSVLSLFFTACSFALPGNSVVVGKFKMICVPGISGRMEGAILGAMSPVSKEVVARDAINELSLVAWASPDVSKGVEAFVDVRFSSQSTDVIRRSKLIKHSRFTGIIRGLITTPDVILCAREAKLRRMSESAWWSHISIHANFDTLE